MTEPTFKHKARPTPIRRVDVEGLLPADDALRILVDCQAALLGSHLIQHCLHSSRLQYTSQGPQGTDAGLPTAVIRGDEGFLCQPV